MTLSEWKEGWKEGFKVGMDMGYLSAAIDGEGCISIAKTKFKGKYVGYGLIVGITNTDQLFLKVLKDICLSKGNITPKTRDDTTKKQAYIYYIPIEVFRELLPHLRLMAKLEQRLIVEHYFEIVSSSGYPRPRHTESEKNELERLYLKMKESNRR